MANSEYTQQALANYKEWEDNILTASKLRGRGYPPVIITSNNNGHDIGYDVVCNECGTKIEVRETNNEFAHPLVEKLVHCPIDEPGHGYWASLINLVIN